MTPYASKSAFQPDELKALKTVFDDLTSQSWFKQSKEAREDFARYVFETCPAVNFDTVKHRSVLETSARLFYTRD
jgi:hypothetical protein